MSDDQKWASPQESECRAFYRELPEFLEGAEGTSVRAHAGHCPRCRGVLADLEAIRSAARDLPESEPTARVWFNLRAALAAEGLIHSSPSWREEWLTLFGLKPKLIPLGAIAALAILSVALVTPRGLTNMEGPALGTHVTASQAATVAQAHDASGLEKMLAVMENQYRTHSHPLDPVLQAAYDKSLSSVNGSIKECSRSVSDQPDDALARQYLMNAYAVKAEVLASAMEFNGQ